jgi:cytochrome c oxidase assembly factor CtaG
MTLAHGADPATPPFSAGRLLTEAELLDWATVGLVLAAAVYLWGVYRLRARGDRWPLARTVLFLGPGLGSVAVALVSGLAAYDETLLSAHMTQHMVLSMVAPVFLALGAPLTLALRTLPRRPRRVLLAVVHSRPVTLLAFPLVAFVIFVASPFALYFTELYHLSLDNTLVHEWVHVHFLIAGCLFFWPLLGLDPLPGRWPYPGRVLLMLLMVPFHTVLGLTIYQGKSLLAGDYYPSLGLTWADPAADQQLAGAILWASGELISVAVLGVIVVQWIRASEREARRIDRELDRVEAAEAARAAQAAEAAPAAGAAGTAQPGDTGARAVRSRDGAATISP